MPAGSGEPFKSRITCRSHLVPSFHVPVSLARTVYSNFTRNPTSAALIVLNILNVFYNLRNPCVLPYMACLLSPAVLSVQKTTVNMAFYIC